jgi:hypothetical protein
MNPGFLSKVNRLKNTKMIYRLFYRVLFIQAIDPVFQGILSIA